MYDLVEASFDLYFEVAAECIWIRHFVCGFHVDPLGAVTHSVCSSKSFSTSYPLPTSSGL